MSSNMFDYEWKFFCINTKRLDELKEVANTKFRDDQETRYMAYEACERLRSAISHFVNVYEGLTRKDMNQQYLIVNQDEPYAGKIMEIIRDGELVKKSKELKN